MGCRRRESEGRDAPTWPSPLELLARERVTHTHTKKRIARTGRGAPRAYFTSKGLLELKRRHEVVRDRDKTGVTL